MIIRKIRDDEIATAGQLLPENWNANLNTLYNIYKDTPDFLPLVAVENRFVVAYGQALIFNKTAWLSNISVDKKYRNGGLGRAITDKLIDHCYDRGAQSIHLMATDMGESLYRRIGFNEDTTYLFYKGRYNGSINQSIYPIENSDKQTILNINYRVTGEVKDAILTPHLSSGYKYLDRKGNIAGFCLPNFGNGLILAMNDEAGIELLKFKHSKKSTVSVLSEENEIGVNFLEEINFTKMKSSKRMYFGYYTEWHPQCTFSRGTTYTG